MFYFLLSPVSALHNENIDLILFSKFKIEMEMNVEPLTILLWRVEPGSPSLEY